MNCPMCGAPLGDNDFECSKCFTKRSEMGPAYNNNGGSSYQSGGYGNNGYGNGGYDNGGNQNNGYGTSYNTSYGSTNNYGSSNGLGGTGNYGGMGYSSAGVNTGSGNRVITIILVIVFVLAAGYFLFIKPSTFKTFDTGDFTVSLPSNCSETQALGLDVGTMGEVKAYDNRDMQFASVCIDFKGANAKQMSELKDAFLPLLDEVYSGTYTNYTKKSLTDDMLKFSFKDKDSDTYYAELKTVYQGDKMYVIICMCMDEDSGKMVPKFPKIFDSIKFK